MLTIGLTGGIGSGKSLVAEYFVDFGAVSIDADQLARTVIEQGTNGFDRVIDIFGDAILRNGEIDRQALGEIVFKNPLLKAKLETIIHPLVRLEFETFAASLHGNQILVYEIPLLFETGSADRFDIIVTVEAEMDIRIARLLAKGLAAATIKERVAAQATSDERKSIADYLIENSGSKDDLRRKVKNIWDDLASTLS